MTLEESEEWIRKTCGEGWVPLVSKIYNEIPDGSVVTSIYQKWGALMFEAVPWNENLDEIFEKIEEKSLNTCEVCGKHGAEATINNWVHTRCELHAK